MRFRQIEAAESSCSSLSSGDGPGDGVASSGFVLLPGNGSQPPSDVVVYEGSVSVRPGQPLVLAMVPPGSVSQQQLHPEFTTIPLGWKRLVSNGVVIYISPSNTVLSSMDQVKEYLMTQGTCKCGLECPLKCDTVFNFDPKVLGKPCILTPDMNIGDLTKLCNHKRKLLAMTCSASSPSGAVAGAALTVGAGSVGVVGPKPSTPVTGMAGSNPPAGNGANTTGTTPSPPDPNKLLRKDGSIKRKKRKIGGPYSGISVSQLLAQREKMALAQQQAMANNQPIQQQIWSGLPNSQSISIQQQNNRVGGFIDPSNGQIVRYQPQNQNRVVSSSPMMINNTMIPQGNQMQQQQIQHQLNQSIPNPPQIVHQHIQQQPQALHHQQIAQQNVNQQQMQPNQIHFQQNIIGANGQVITVQPQANTPQNQINVGSMNVITHPDVVMQGENIMQQQRIVMGGQQDDSQGTINRQIQHVGMSMNNNGASVQQQEIIQRIQQQQQIINQSMQIGQPRPEDQTKIIPQFDSKNVRHFVPIGNGGAPPNTVFNIRPDGIAHANNRTMPNAIIMPQHKTPPWQQNKINNIQQNSLQHQNQQVVMSTQQINQQPIQQNSGNIYERVPPLHHHTPPPPVWNDDANRKKNKISKPSKKQRPYNIMDHHQRISAHEGHLACPNIDVRQIPNEHHRSNQQLSQETSSPSFMEDPSGYLAQQTALLNSTISRQTGINNGVNFLCRQGPATPPQNNQQISTSQPSGSPVAIPLPSNIQQPKQIQCYTARSSSNISTTSNVKVQQNSMSPIQQNMNSVQVEMNSPVNSMMQTSDCQSCVTTSQMGANQYQQFNNKVQNEHQKQYQISRPNSHPSAPTNSVTMKDDPVTSSNYNDKFTNVMPQPSPDLRPIQGGTISTSDGSPMEFQPQSSSPSPNTSLKNASTPNMILSNSSPQFVMPSHHSPGPYAVSTSRNPTSNYSQPVPNSLTMAIATNGNVQKSQSYSMQPSSPSNLNISTTSQNKMIEGYCPPPHAAGGLDLPVPYQPRTVTTMASGRTSGSNTITSVLAGRAQTATVSVNTPAVVPTLGLPNTSTNFQQNVQCPQASNSVNISKSPLEMVQSVVSSIQVPHSQNTLNAININTNQAQISPQQIVKSTPSQGLPPGHILVSSGGGQLIMTNNGQATMMPPPPPKIVTNTSSMPPISVSPLVTNVTGAVTQVIPTVGMAQQVLGQQTVLVNALPGPFVIQPGVMAVDGMTVGQNMQLPQIVTGNVIQHQIQLENNGEQGRPPSQGFTNRPPTLISPDGGKRKGKKRKMGSQTVASMLHVAAQQNSGVVMQQQAGFSPQGFQMAHSPQGVNAGPVLQALTIVPGKGGAPPQIVMNGQASTTSPFGTQQLITNSQPTQQINLLQPVNLLNNTTGMVQNFPTIQQFIVPGLGGMVMATDGSGTATLLPDTPSVGMQLQLQNVNGQNVLTPVQNHGNTVFGATGGQSILAAGPAGMVIRTPASSQGKLIQQQHSPGAQFLSPNGGQFVMNGAQFNGQLSPLVASVSPSQQVTVRPNSSVQQEFIQCGQMGQTLMVPCTPSNPQTIAVSTASGQQNTTFVQQNTTIVQQQTTMVSNNPQIQNFPNGGQNVVSNTQNINNNINGMNLDQNFVMNNSNVQGDGPKQNVGLQQQPQQSMNAALLMQRHSVSTQTAVGQSSNVGTTVSAGAGSPPDTTTHSPLAPGADTTTHEGTSPSPPNCTIIRDHQPTHSMAMVHCVSSSEPDAADISTDWSRCSSAGSATPKSADCTDFTLLQTNTHFGNGQPRKSLTPTYVESTVSILSEVNMKQDTVVSSQKPVKRKHSDTLVMETRQMRSSLQDDDTDESRSSGPGSPVVFAVGDLVWGAARGCPAWPGKLVDGPNSCDGRVWVRWFGGDRTPMAVDPATLQTLTQGLDAHHRARKKCRKSRKLNAQLENAIQEAMAELDRISEQHQKQSIDSSDSSQSITKSHLETKNLISQSPFKKDATRLRSSQK